MMLDEIRHEYEHACCMSTRPGVGFVCPRDGAVLDEEKSVRWNREEVQRLRHEFAEEQTRLSMARNHAISEATEKAIKWIAEVGGFTGRQAKTIWDFAYDRHHSDGSVFLMLDEYMNFADGLLRYENLTADEGK